MPGTVIITSKLILVDELSYMACMQRRLEKGREIGSFVSLPAHPLEPTHQGKDVAVNLNQFTLVMADLEKSRKLKLLRNRRFGGLLLDFSYVCCPKDSIPVTTDNELFMFSCLVSKSVTRAENRNQYQSML